MTGMPSACGEIPQGMNESYQPICSGGYPLSYYGKDGNYLKFRYPDIMGDCECFCGSGWYSFSEYGYTKKLSWIENTRLLGYPYRGSYAWKKSTIPERLSSVCFRDTKSTLILITLFKRLFDFREVFYFLSDSLFPL